MYVLQIFKFSFSFELFLTFVNYCYLLLVLENYMTIYGTLLFFIPRRTCTIIEVIIALLKSFIIEKYQIMQQSINENKLMSKSLVFIEIVFI